MQISPTIGAKLWQELLYHDDGIMDKGGEQCGIIGKMGTGKSTIMLQVAELCRYFPTTSKRRAVTNLMRGADLTSYDTRPETVLWRGRGNDYWNCLIPENFNKSFPNYQFNPKPVVVMVHEDDDLVFYHSDYEGRVHPVKNFPELITYKDADDMIRQIREGWINVCYEPQSYVLNEYLIKKLKARALESSDDDSESQKGKKKKRRRKTGSEFEDPCPPLFWFEVIGKLLNKKPVHFLTLIIDEFHQMCLARPTGNMWHIIDIFASNFVDLRRNNISLIFSTHQTSFIDYRVADRLAKWIWLPGAKLSPAYSMVFTHVVGKLPLGQLIIEDRLSEFGVVEFSRIPKQPPLLRVDGVIE